MRLPFFLPWPTWLRPLCFPFVSAITIGPIVLLKDQSLLTNPAFINHERIHFRQQLELLFLPFFLLYTLEFLLRLAYYHNLYTAYRNISFEREAYANQDNPNYLQNRKPLHFLLYLFADTNHPRTKDPSHV